MKIYTITFSPTGGTNSAADLIAGQLQGEKKKISMLSEKTDYAEYEFDAEDVCVIAVPSFGGRVPTAVIPRLLAMKGNGARCVPVCVYGNRAYEDTLLELKNTAKQAGFRPIAAAAAIAEHSIMRQFAAGRPDEQDHAELQEFGKRIQESLDSGEELPEVWVPGNEPYREFGGVPFVPKPGRKCIRCGRCARECPVGAIDMEDPKHVDTEKCISCMRCAAVCPGKVRGLNKLLVTAAAAKMAKAFETRKDNELFMGQEETAER